MNTVIYRGYRHYKRAWDGQATTLLVSVQKFALIGGEWMNQGELNPRFDLREHSPTGFEWGYGGSGPTQLSMALVADACGDDKAVPRIYQAFKRIIADLPKEYWEIDKDFIVSAVEGIEKLLDPPIQSIFPD